jgi:hypothetical protein
MTGAVVVDADGRGGFVLTVDVDGVVLSGAAPAFVGRTAPCTADDVAAAWHALQDAGDDDGVALADRVRRRPAGAAWAAWQVAWARRAHRACTSLTLQIARDLALPAAPSVRTAGLVLDAGAGTVPTMPSVKWKTPPATATTLRAFRSTRPATRLRLDGNRALTSTEAQILADVAGAALQFFEEPTPPADLARCAARMPLALDESLVDCDLDVDDALQLGARVLVLKPATLGPARTLSLALGARRHGLDVVVSAVGEDAAGLRALVALQAVVGTLDAGLGTYSWRAETRSLFDDDGVFVGALP